MVLPAVQHKRRSSWFTLWGHFAPFCPHQGNLYEGRVTHKLTGTQDRVARRSLLVQFLLLMVLEVIVVAHCGCWTCPVDMHLAHSVQERQNKSWIFAEKMF